MIRTVSLLAAAAVLSAGLVGCSGSSAPAAVPPTTPTAAPTAAACPGAHAASHVGTWPRPIPADLPKPPTGTRARVTFQNGDITVVAFKTQLSLTDAVLFVLHRFPPAGFLLGRGDAEAFQADAPFSRSGVYGQVRINAYTACATQWLVAVGTPQNNSGSPLLAPPSTTATPAPFASFGTFGG